MKYYATFSANNGNTYNESPYVYTNKRKAVAEIRSIVDGEHFRQVGNTSRYAVRDENGIYVAVGSIHDRGWWSVNHDVIGTRG